MEVEMIKLIIIATDQAIHIESTSYFRLTKSKKEFVMDYSMYDAFFVGFEEIIIVTSRENRNDYKRKYAQDNRIKVMYEDVVNNKGKSLGSAHAVYCAINQLNGPFAVINNHNFYGRDAFEKAYQLLKENKNGMIGYHIADTYSVYGPVSRGVCDIKMNTLFSIAEVENIEGDMFSDAIVSMEFWCFSLDFTQLLKESYLLIDENDRQSEHYKWSITSMIKNYLNKEKMHVQMSYGNSFSITYQADLKDLKRKIKMLKEKGIYPNVLFNEHCE